MEPNEESSYIANIQSSLIPQGTKHPHPTNWKGQGKLKFTGTSAIKDTIVPFAGDIPGVTRRTAGVLKRKRKRKPTAKQVATAQYLLQGYSARQARLKAGYAPMTVDHKSYKANNRGLLAVIDSMRSQLAIEGLDDAYMVQKFKQWMEAQKIVTSHTEPDRTVPDYDVQLKAYDRWEKIVNTSTEHNGNAGKRRELTITEFITEETPQE